jgi:hypothetical protein
MAEVNHRRFRNTGFLIVHHSQLPDTAQYYLYCSDYVMLFMTEDVYAAMFTGHPLRTTQILVELFPNIFTTTTSYSNTDLYFFFLNISNHGHTQRATPSSAQGIPLSSTGAPVHLGVGASVDFCVHIYARCVLVIALYCDNLASITLHE